jgi:hypothetical protein
MVQTQTPLLIQGALQDFKIKIITINMKNNLHSNPLIFKMIVLVTCFMLVMLYNKSKGG